MVSVGGLGLAGLSLPAVIIRQHLGGRQGSLWLIRAGAGCAPGSFQRGSERPAMRAARPSHSSWHRHLSPKPVRMKGCLHDRGKKKGMTAQLVRANERLFEEEEGGKGRAA